MPPFDVRTQELGEVPSISWVMSLDEAREVAELLYRVDDSRAHEMAFDLRQGVQRALSQGRGQL